MTDKRPNPFRCTVPLGASIGFVLAACLLTACSGNPAASSGPKLRVYAADVAGAAKVCDAAVVTPAADSITAVAVKMNNDGGWCGLRADQSGPKPFDAGLLTKRPAKGSVLIHQVGDDTRIDYTPDRGFAGTDAFTVKLIPGSEILNIAVTVGSP